LEDLDRLRADPTYWRRLAARPEVCEALHLASPGLVRRLAAGSPDPRVAAAVTAYLVRMCTRALLPKMITRGSGAVVNVSTMAASASLADAPVYAATKAALESLTRSRAAAFGANGIRVNTVAPGPTRKARFAARG
jgi:NAD(P)-dependent dehydrogenase (short-subunit alcohol dehydrogenase family)